MREVIDREAAADWVDKHALGQRNLTPDGMTLLLGRRYNRAKQPHGGNQAGWKVRAQNELKGPNATAIRIGAEHGRGHAAVVRAGKSASAVGTLVVTVISPCLHGRPL